jgi:hypothetical protein
VKVGNGQSQRGIREQVNVKKKIFMHFVGKGKPFPTADLVKVVGVADKVCGDARESMVSWDARVCVRKAV